MTNLDRDIFFLAFVAFAEASDQGQVGIRAQQWSVVNRHNAVDGHGKARWYAGKTLAGTIFVPYAYSALNTQDTNRIRAAVADMDNVIMQICLTEAAAAIAGTSVDPTSGGTHYYRIGTPPPDWCLPATGSVYTSTIGAHKFFKNVA